jgi:hypothetical protein
MVSSSIPHNLLVENPEARILPNIIFSSSSGIGISLSRSTAASPVLSNLSIERSGDVERGSPVIVDDRDIERGEVLEVLVEGVRSFLLLSRVRQRMRKKMLVG